MSTPKPKVLLIDNFDSFTYNITQSLSLLGSDVITVRNDAVTLQDIRQMQVSHIVLSPGPGHPISDSGICMSVLQEFSGVLPIFGVCLGLQAIFCAFGGTVGSAGECKHGKTSSIVHDGRGLFSGVPSPISAVTRYHSLAADVSTCPKMIAISATTEESGVVMALRHREFTVEGVQYHPESILSECGEEVFRNFLSLRGGKWSDNEGANVGLQPVENKVSILQQIKEKTLQTVAEQSIIPGQTERDLQALILLDSHPSPVSLYQNICRSNYKISVIAEIKRASPSKGLISHVCAPLQASIYAKSEAVVGVSVLTEPEWFKGTIADMRAARDCLPERLARVAVLRKDFILSKWQIDQSVLSGADTVLLIVSLLTEPGHLQELYSHCQLRGLEPLVEVNTTEEMLQVLEMKVKLIGINNRNLHSFSVDISTTAKLVSLIKDKRDGYTPVVVALSGISTPADVQAMFRLPYVRAVLIGEALMRAADPVRFIRELLTIPHKIKKDPKQPLIKMCGVRSVEDAQMIVKTGKVDFIGLIFAEKSKRRISLKVGREIVNSVRQVSGENDELDSNRGDEDINQMDWFDFHAYQTKSRLYRTSGKRPLVVGVFQDQSLSYVQEVIDKVGIDLIQLHGSEPAHWAQYLSVPVIKTFHMPVAGVKRVPGSQVNASPSNSSAALPSEAALPVVSDLQRTGAFQLRLLDTAKTSSSGHAGGSGQTFDWASSGACKGPFILAGGLHSANVQDAINATRPWAIDVCSGVENEEGFKNSDKIDAFIKAVVRETKAAKDVAASDKI